MTTKPLFVYGTLRSEIAAGYYSLLKKQTEYLGKGHIQGRLYEIDGYPGAVESDYPEDKVFGELYQVTGKERFSLFSRLDEYEGCSARFPEPHEYVRKTITAKHKNGKTATAWVYLYNWDIFDLKRIYSGDYVSFLNEKLA